MLCFYFYCYPFFLILPIAICRSVFVLFCRSASAVFNCRKFYRISRKFSRIFSREISRKISRNAARILLPRKRHHLLPRKSHLLLPRKSFSPLFFLPECRVARVPNRESTCPVKHQRGHQLPDVLSSLCPPSLDHHHHDHRHQCEHCYCKCYSHHCLHIHHLLLSWRFRQGNNPAVPLIKTINYPTFTQAVRVLSLCQPEDSNLCAVWPFLVRLVSLLNSRYPTLAFCRSSLHSAFRLECPKIHNQIFTLWMPVTTSQRLPA